VATLSIVLLIIYALLYFSKKIRGAFLRGIAGLWHLITRRSLQKQMADFDNAIEQIKIRIEKQPAVGLVLLGLMLGDWFFALTTLELCFMAIGLTAPFTSHQRVHRR
jgi:hypothetical protein